MLTSGQREKRNLWDSTREEGKDLKLRDLRDAQGGISEVNEAPQRQWEGGRTF